MTDASNNHTYAYASMDAFTTDVTKIGVPTAGSGAFFQQNVSHMDVLSNVGGVATGTNLSGGNIEFWNSNYTATNSKAVPNASASAYDFGDHPSAGGYGSMQIHNHFVTATTGQTVLAYNRWGSGNSGNSDIGIGNNPSNVSGQNPDWTFAQNAGAYTVKNLQVLVHLGTPPPAPPVIKIMPLGDSITDGSGAAGGYRTKLYNDLTNAGLNVSFVGSATDNNSATLINAGQVNHEGHSGYRIDQITNNLDASDASSGNNGGFWFPGGGTTGRSAVSPDYILLLIGTNDFGQNFSTATAKDRLDALITRITGDRPGAKLIVSNLLKRTDNATAEAGIETQFNPFVPQIVANHQALGQSVYFLDLNSVINPATDLGDGLHPNQAGYDKMGDAWFNAIQATPEPTAFGFLPCLAVLLLRRKSRAARA